MQVVRGNGEIWVCEMLTYTHLQGDVATRRTVIGYRRTSLGALVGHFGGLVSFFHIPIFHYFYVQLALFFFNFFFRILAN